MPHRILLSGARDQRDDTQLTRVLSRWRARCPDGVLVHGDCATGIDRMGHALWHERWGLPVEPHPANWSLGRKAGPRRNQHMVDLGADVALIFPLPTSRGSIGCGRMAEAAGIPTWWFFPDRIIPARAGPQRLRVS